MASQDQQRFESLYSANFRLIVAYAARRTRETDDALDVAAETFLTAWRRLNEVPKGDLSLAWLYGTARRVLANSRRAYSRQERLVAKLVASDEISRRDAVLPGSASTSEEMTVIAQAWARLHVNDRELLSLVAWEGLSRRELGLVLGWSEGKARVRLHRARKRFARELLQEGVVVPPSAHYQRRARTERRVEDAS